MKDRGKPISAPKWWLNLAVAQIRKEQEAIGLVELGRLLAKQIGRHTPYNHSVLVRFVDDEHPPKTTTQELAMAISLRYALPRPFYEPRSEREARGMQSIAEAYDPHDPVRSDRKADALRRFGELEREKLDHTAAVSSPDEARGQGSRRHRRTLRRS